MNEKITITELKYNNKKTLQTAIKSCNNIRAAVIEISYIVNKLYDVVALGVPEKVIKELQRDVICEGATLIGG